MNIDRRTVNGWALAGLAAGLTTPFSLRASASKYAPVRKDDGQFGSYTQPWFLESFLEFADDLKEAKAAGKRFALMWELDGCPYCRETHLVNFAVPEINEYVRANFEIVQLDVRGAREVVNFDGTAMTERELAKLFRVRHTPTIQFFPETLAELQGKAAPKFEIARMPGYLRPFHFYTFFRFVREKAYATGNFHKYLNAQVAELKKAGKSLPAW
ncbi:MAG: thioredoxin family protein [Magnetovibrio sp.]|nr:thioredoxin family protein [Magnetovibrio sp.]